MYKFKFNFSITFDPDPNKGYGKGVTEKQHWRIGIVQNVIFEMMKFEYNDGAVLKTGAGSRFLSSTFHRARSRRLSVTTGRYRIFCTRRKAMARLPIPLRASS